MSVLGCDPQVFQGLHLLGSRKCCFTARVYWFSEVYVGRQSGQDHLEESYQVLPYLLV